jgi:hypothetical protein
VIEANPAKKSTQSETSKADSIQFYKRAHTKNTAQEQEEEIKTQQWPD